MTARKPAKPSPRKRIAKKQDQDPDNGWPAVVRCALEDWPHTLRFCVIVLVVGALLLVAMRFGLRLWL